MPRAASISASGLDSRATHSRMAAAHSSKNSRRSWASLPGDGGLFERLDGRRQDAGREALLALDTLRLWLQRVSYGRSPLIIGPSSQLTKPIGAERLYKGCDTILKRAAVPLTETQH